MKVLLAAIRSCLGLCPDRSLGPFSIRRSDSPQCLAFRPLTVWVGRQSRRPWGRPVPADPDEATSCSCTHTLLQHHSLTLSFLEHSSDRQMHCLTLSFLEHSEVQSDSLRPILIVIWCIWCIWSIAIREITTACI